jgi:hypothetical protein
MIYPAQTSLMPIPIALARFLEQGGSFLGNYPYWYLGTTPYRYLTGPILTPLLASLHRLLPSLSLFEISLIATALFFAAGGAGLYLLVSELGGGKRAALFATFFYLLGPLIPTLFRFSDGVYLFAFSLLPLALTLYLRFLKEPSLKKALPAGVIITLLMLITTNIVSVLLLGMGALFLATSDWGGVEEKIKKSAFLFIASTAVATLWYTPGFWLTLVGAPSLAGKSFFRVIFDLGKILPTALAISFAVLSTKFLEKRDHLRDFALYWTIVFGIMSMIRFISDPDFWMDWSRYTTELQMGVAIGVGFLLGKREEEKKIPTKAIAIVALLLLSFLFLTHRYVAGTFQKEIKSTVEYQIGEKLSEIVPTGEKVLLSGSTAFWLNAFFDVHQVRGGVDQASTDNQWREALWEVREGEDPEKSYNALKELGVGYLVVHTENSREFYHDFTFPDKFEEEEKFEKIYEEEGDRIYQLLD